MKIKLINTEFNPERFEKETGRTLEETIKMGVCKRCKKKAKKLPVTVRIFSDNSVIWWHSRKSNANTYPCEFNPCEFNI